LFIVYRIYISKLVKKIRIISVVEIQRSHTVKWRANQSTMTCLGSTINLNLFTDYIY